MAFRNSCFVIAEQHAISQGFYYIVSFVNHSGIHCRLHFLDSKMSSVSAG